MREAGLTITAYCSAAALLLFQQTAHCALKKSSYDKERDREAAERHRDADRQQAEKLNAEAREKKEQKWDDIRNINRDEYLRRHPTALYNARIMGRYGMKDGKPVRFVPITGTVAEILDAKRILASVPVQGKTPVTVAVVFENNHTFAKGDKMSVPNLIDDGTLSYSLPNGTPIAARTYRQVPGITLKEFLQLRKDGFVFPEEATFRQAASP